MLVPCETKVLVTGAGGFLGTHVVNELIARKFIIKCFDIFVPQSALKDRDWIVGSIENENLFSSAVQGCQVVVFLVGGSLPGSANADMATEVTNHVRTAVKAAEISRHAGVELFIFASSGGTVYGSCKEINIDETYATKPINAYGVSKVAIENYLRVMSDLYGIRTVSLRISNPFGEEQKAHKNQGFIAAAFEAAQKGRVLTVWGDGSAVRDFIYVKDVARAFALACSYGGPATILNIGSGEGRSLNDIVKYISNYCKKNLAIRFDGDRRVDVSRNVLDISRARSVLNWEPLTDFATGMTITSEWWDNN